MINKNKVNYDDNFIDYLNDIFEFYLSPQEQYLVLNNDNIKQSFIENVEKEYSEMYKLTKYINELNCYIKRLFKETDYIISEFLNLKGANV